MGIEMPLQPIELQETPLHSLLRESLVWTVTTWRWAVEAVLQSLDEDGIWGMHEFAFGGAAGNMTKEQALDEFYFWPPTVMLGAFDLIRGYNFVEVHEWKQFPEPTSPSQAEVIGLLDATVVRQWARKEGIPVPERGRVPQNLYDLYRECRKTGATPRPVRTEAPAGTKAAGAPS